MRIEESRSLRPFNTFGIDVRARYFTEVRSAEEFEELLSDRRFSEGRKCGYINSRIRKRMECFG